MKPSAFNSIDNKKTLQSLAEWYTVQVHKLYMGLIEERGGDSARSLISVDSYFKGVMYKEKTVAGLWAIKKLLFHFKKENFPQEVQKLDNFFLKNCECDNAQDVLDFLSLRIMIIGQDSSDLKSWMKAIGDFSSCETVKSRIPS